jgi:hypothetical protein
MSTVLPLSPMARFGAAVAGFLLVAGCAATTASAVDPSPSAGPNVVEAPRVAEAPGVTEAPGVVDAPIGSLTTYCARRNADVVSERICAAPPITSLLDLQKALGVAQLDAKRGNGMAGNASFALLGHSTSSAARLVSPINPRAFLFSSPASVGRVRGALQPDPDFVALAFTRGEQTVELVARDRKTDELRFFLIRFDQACNAEPGGCSSYDMFSPAIERDWTAINVFEDVDLANTVLDCATCHQPNGPRTSKILRMNELQQPWTHFFRDLDSGRSLIEDYYLAHDESETYAGIKGRTIRHSQPTRLEGLVEHEGHRDQLDEFPGAALGYGLSQGILPEASPRFADMFARAQRGLGLPLPAPMARPHDDERLQQRAAAYRAVMKGKQPAAAMPSLADMQRDDTLWMSSQRPKPDSSGPEMLQQMCNRCHHPGLDQSLSRARFDVSRLLGGKLDAAAREEAVARLLLPDDSPKKMPPPRFGRLSDEEIGVMIEALRE